jgi:hypothetical protein
MRSPRLGARVRAGLAFVLGSLLSVCAARAFSGLCADALGDSIGATLATLLGPVSSGLAPAESDIVLTEAELMGDAPASRVLGGPNKITRAAKHGGKSPTLHAIRISSAQVLALASHRAMPDAAPVRASAEHPAGLLLRGVSGLGVGLQDGDVLTEAAGQRASSVAAVIGVVLAARARHSSEISGRFFRAGVPYVVTVEQPYPPGT